MQAPRHLLQDLHSTKAQTYAIEHEAGRDYGTPPFSLDFAKAKHAGILVRVFQRLPVALLLIFLSFNRYFSLSSRPAPANTHTRRNWAAMLKQYQHVDDSVCLWC